MNIDKQENSSKQTFLQGLTSMFPGFKYLGLGVWFAWVFLAYGSTLWLSDVEINGSWLATMFFICYGLSAAVLLISPFCPKLVDRILVSRTCIMLAGLAVMLGALAIILAGPYYIAQPWLFYLGCVVLGIVSPVIVLRLGRIYGSTAPRNALIYASLSQMGTAVLYFSVLSNGIFVPTFGGPSIAAIAAFLVLPVVTAFIISIPPLSRPKTDVKSDKEQPHQFDSSKLQKNVGMLSPVFWKLMVAVLIFTTVSNAVRGFVLNLSSVDATLFAGHIDILIRLTFAMAFFFFAVRFTRRLALGKLYLFIMVIIATIVAVYPLLDIAGSPLRVIVSFASDLFDFIIWCLLAFIVYQKKIDATIVFGFGRGVFMLGSAAGLLLGINVLPLLASAGMEVVSYAVMAVLILVAVTLVFSERDFDRLFSSNIAETDLTLEDITRFVDLEREGISTELGVSGQSEHERPYIAACKSVGDEAHLSAREQDVFIELALGRGSESISKRLFVSINTARTHTHNIYTKLGVHSRQELINLVDEEFQKGK